MAVITSDQFTHVTFDEDGDEAEVRLKEQRGTLYIRLVTCAQGGGGPVWLSLKQAHQLHEALGDAVWLGELLSSITEEER